ncbi:MAG TPA: BPL-N domain-containing protein [Terriglobia bacterium]|nr:BPL-N domain-containing protein [Terriglobia bacterium]
MAGPSPQNSLRRKLLRLIKFDGGVRVAAALCLAAYALIACGRVEKPAGPPSILLFNGTGTSPNDVSAIEEILRSKRFAYSTADSAQLERMTSAELRAYRLLIVPGGNFEQIGQGLTSAATANIRHAVEDGLNYLGICAGAFFAGDSPYNGLNLTSGTRFGFYGIERQGVRKAAVPIAPAGSPPLDQYWEDGPQLSGWGAAVARYPDGTPAVVQGTFGDGWIILSGVHAEAPENWRKEMKFNTPVSVDNAYAASLIEAALNRIELPHY